MEIKSGKMSLALYIEVDVNKRTVTMEDNFNHIYEQLSIFSLFYWPHLGIY